MSFTKIRGSQKKFLENYLRGTGRTITERDARARFGISNLRARMTEFRKAGLRVVTEPSTTGASRYAVRARDVNGSRSKVFN